MKVRLVPTRAYGYVSGPALTAVPGVLRLRRPSRTERIRRNLARSLPDSLSPRLAVPLLAAGPVALGVALAALRRARRHREV